MLTFAVLIGISLVLGVAITPLFAIVFGSALNSKVPALSQAFGSWLFTVGQLALDGGVLTELEDGSYEMRRGSHLGPKSRWSRLGKAPFAVTYEKSPDAFGAALVEPSDVGDALADGGVRVMGAVRAGLRTFVPDVDFDKHYLVRTSSLDALRSAGGIKASMDAQEFAMKKFGGGTEISDKLLLAAIMAMIVCGAAAGLVMV